MRNWIKYVIPVLVIAAMATILVNSNLTLNTANVAGAGSGISYHSAVCKVVTRADGVTEDLGCTKNLFANQGKNITRDLLGSYTSLAAVTAIGLGNGSGATTAGTNLGGLIAECGLNAQAGTYAVVDTSPGNWSVQKQFTALCNNHAVNSTALYNATAAGTANFFAANNFTTTTLQANDQITITWYVWVT